MIKCWHCFWLSVSFGLLSAALGFFVSHFLSGIVFTFAMLQLYTATKSHEEVGSSSNG